jgi:hypothetical protein
MTTNIPTVRLIDLVKDNCNFTDKTFENFVDRWMDANMPGLPMGLLDTTSEIAMERWQVQCDSRHEVRSALRTVHECSECGYLVEECKEDHSDVERVAVTKTTERVWVVYNSSKGEYLADQQYVRDTGLLEDYDDVMIDEQEGVLGWLDKSEATVAMKSADEAYHAEHGHEDTYGFPWANSWAFRPDRYVSDDSLRAAGFRIATYRGGAGNWREDDEYRLAGIDGGGYSFSGSHFARLVAAHHESRNMTVETDKGPAYITTETRTDLEILADATQVVTA